ncbi:MAG TPA: exodeoxyribonuclease V subunit alpha [Aliidiomarina sp.]|nr:exodeoxyribonuclease V subunit alpha [Aliidiomarina sp.]
MNVEQSLRTAVAARQLRALDVELVASLNRMQPEPDTLVQLLTALVSYQYGRGHSCFDLPSWCQSPAITLGYSDKPSWLTEATKGLNLANVVARLNASGWCSTNGSAPLTLLGDKLYLTRLFNAEQTIREAIASRIGTQRVDIASIQAALEALFPEQRNAASSAEVNWQKLACAMAALRHFSIITGGPGTGKTTTVVRLLGLLQHQANGSLNIVLAAPTGKAAARLQESIGNAVEQLDKAFQLNIPTAVSTLHRLLGSRPGKRSFRHDSSNPLTADVVIVDEASMVDAEMMAALLSAVKPEARLVLLGDKDQLASVEAGSVLADLCEGANEGSYNASTLDYLNQFTTGDMSGFEGPGSGYNQATVMLRRSYRFGADSGIGELSRAVNVGRSHLQPIFAAFNDINWLQTDPASSSVRKLILDGYQPLFELVQRGPAGISSDDWAKQVLKQQRAFQVLCAMRKGDAGVNAMNERMTQWLRLAGLIDTERQWYAGRAVMVEQNNYHLNLMNGDVGMTLWHPETNQLRVVFEAGDGSLRWVLPARLSQTSTVFAMTIHKSQGSEFTHTVMVLPSNMQPLLTRELLYTAITRASETFTMIAEQPHVVRQACEQRVQRSSGL